ncbi:MAG: VenA family class IV lanthipeptide [Pseudonocardiaceae bacterium]
MSNFDLVSSLQALPETSPVELDGIQFGGGTCGSQCVLLTVNVVQTVCLIAATCC